MSDFYSIVQLQIQLDELVHKVNCLHGKLKIVNVKAHEKEWRALGRELISKSKGRLRFHQICKDEFVLDIFDEEDHDAQVTDSDIELNEEHNLDTDFEELVDTDWDDSASHCDSEDDEEDSFVMDTSDSEDWTELEGESDAESLCLEDITLEELTNILDSSNDEEDSFGNEVYEINESNQGTSNQVCELSWDELKAEVGVNLKKRCLNFCGQLKKSTEEVRQNINTLEELVEAMGRLSKIIEENSGWIKQKPGQMQDPAQKYEEAINIYKFLIADAKQSLKSIKRLAQSLPHLKDGPEPVWPWEERRPLPNAWA